MSEHHHHYHSHTGSNIGFVGTIIAMLLSWTTWHSLGWAIVNGLFGWFYVIYYLLKYGWPLA